MGDEIHPDMARMEILIATITILSLAIHAKEKWVFITYIPRF